MASTAAKAKRRAMALNRLDDLAVQTADHFGVEVPDLRVTNRDPELAQIQQVEATCDLLERILTSQGVEVAKDEPEATQEAVDVVQDEPDEPEESTAKASKKARKRTTRRKK